MTVVVDTNVLIDVLRGRPVAVAAVRQLIAGEDVLISALTHLELLAGSRIDEQRAVARLVAAVIEMPVADSVIGRAAELARRHAAAHRGIDAIDYVIAATAQVHGARLVTRNVKDFPMFPGLTAPY